MPNEQDTISIRLHGEGISPSSFKAKEVGELLIYLEDAIKKNTPDDAGVDRNSLYISLVGVEDHSLKLECIPNVNAVLLASFLSISAALSGNNISDINQQSIYGLKKIQSILRNKNCDAEFYRNNEVVGVLDRDTNLSVENNDAIKGETTIYGTLERIGGATPRVKLILSNRNILYLDINKRIAKELGSSVYEEIGLTGEATWLRTTGEITDFTVHRIENYSRHNLLDTFEELKGIVGHIYDDIDSIEDALLREI